MIFSLLVTCHFFLSLNNLRLFKSTLFFLSVACVIKEKQTKFYFTIKTHDLIWFIIIFFFKSICFIFFFHSFISLWFFVFIKHIFLNNKIYKGHWYCGLSFSSLIYFFLHGYLFCLKILLFFGANVTHILIYNSIWNAKSHELRFEKKKKMIDDSDA